ncbi:MAG: multidrug effflux MFS transporter [Flavobacteriaceae bacterium]|jgi:DHA1 family bicyclomycin/chloramphenicol resistance-like MFS transporter|nr:multidrug effflux MFS transporter [Flavobacteriaceae bacterium]
MQTPKVTKFEFIALMAFLMSVVALAIDALLPALDIIGNSLHTQENSDHQLLITMIFIGLGVGPLFFGPLSDSLGRKPMVFVGFGIFILASFICVYAKSLEIMVLGRILQGFGLSAPRTISVAIIRDLYAGDYMAKIMSFVIVIFLLVPIIAPAMGKLILDSFNWEAIFIFQIIFCLLIAFWFWKRQEETLNPKNRIDFKIDLFKKGFLELMRFKKTIAYTLISGLITGSFMVYLSTSQQIFQEQYGLKEAFPFIFAGLATASGGAILLNGLFVVKYGMKKIINVSLIGFFLISVCYAFLFYNSVNPPIIIILSFFSLQFFCLGFLFGNLRAIAMEPVGHIAGIGAAITGFISTLMAVPISIVIGKFVRLTVLPIFIGFSICSFISILILIVLTIKAPQNN